MTGRENSQFPARPPGRDVVYCCASATGTYIAKPAIAANTKAKLVIIALFIFHLLKFNNVLLRFND
jgi:hypothetical protein